ncbi:MAG: DnaJ domain-containing protein [bacterium]|nr:DnaJ domain-containing protein [bacterium]
MNTDFYKTLGVAETAGADEIKKVYRKLAKKYHPDRHKGDPKAEARFKEISEAYDTLKDPKKRAEYDNMRKYGPFSGGNAFAGGHPFSGGQPFAGGQPGGFGGEFDFSQFMRGGQGGGTSFHFDNASGSGGFEDVLSSLFGGGPNTGSPFGTGRPQSDRRRRRRTARGSDVHLTVDISFREMVTGTSRTIATRDKGRKISVKIPAGIRHRGKVRLRGQGHLGSYGGEQGDLIITVRVMPDQNFERKGNDIHSSVEISFIEAIRGCKANVKTLTKTVALSVPPGTQPGTKMRLKGMGLEVGGKSGDQYVEIKVTIPQTLTDAQQKLLDEWEG